MPNKTYANEWLNFSKRNLETAQLLYKENHYTDIIAIELQQSIEKTLKSVLAFHNAKIPNTHDLQELRILISSYYKIDEENTLNLLDITTDYYKEDRYPNPYYTLPTRDDIKQILELAIYLHKEITVLIARQ